MAIKFKYRGMSFTADRPEEVAELIDILQKKEAEALQFSQDAEAWKSRMIRRGRDYIQEAVSLTGSYDESKFRWTSDHFEALITRLGQPQKLALALLVIKKQLTDEELRGRLNVSGNQALAGILSGISKQATALYIPPRAIFDFENSRIGGKRRSDYLVVDEFRQIASQMNWPPPDLLTD